MLRGVSVIVIVPAYEEERILPRVLGKMPSCVDRVIVVDDASHDRTAAVAQGFGSRVEVVQHIDNRGVGAAICTGYVRALATTTDPLSAFVVMAGDDQMHGDDLPVLVEPIASGQADYVKGNRFAWPGSQRAMPPLRYVGGQALSWLTSAAIGRRVHDTQCGFTAIARQACARLDLGDLWPRYGYPNDLLGQLTVRGARIVERPVRPVYADEVSRLRPSHVPRILWLIARAGVRKRFSGKARAR